jgi:threonine/homoserine/homoserine lactone efflux protein
VLATIGRMGPAAVAFLAVGATFVNPKNLPLLLGAGATIGSTGSPLWWGLGFVVVATAPYWAVTLYAVLGGEPASQRLDRLRAWLVAHNRLIMGVVCLVLGLVMLLKGGAALL